MAIKTGKTIKNVIRGDTRQISCTFLESDNTTPINLTGGTVYFTVNSSDSPADDSTAVISKNANVFTNAANGNHIFTLTHSDTNITPGDYWYDVQFVDSLGGYLSSFRGKFTVQSDTTRT